MKRTSIQFTCPICGKIFYRKPAEIAKSRTGRLVCSRACRVAWIEWECETCGRRVRKMRCEVGIAHKRRFCSPECANIGMIGKGNPSWTGGYKPHSGKVWRHNRILALQRDGHQCTRCGRTKDNIGKEPDVHHIEKRDRFNTDEDFHALSNLVSLCHKCHIHLETELHKSLKGGANDKG